MMLKLRVLSCALVAALLLSACSANGGSTASAESGSNDTSASAVFSKAKGEDLDASWDEAKATKIILNGDSIDLKGSGATVSGSTVTITSAGTYVAGGSLTDGQIIVNAPETALVRLVLNGAGISSSTTSPIFCEQADKLLIILADGSANTVTDSVSYILPSADTDEPNAAIFSHTDMTFNGTGALTVNANYNNGIGTKDDLIIVSGTFDVTAPNHAIRGRDSVTALDGTFTLNAGNDGIQSNNDSAEDKGWIELYGGSYDITATHDGIQAETWLTVTGGSFHITAGGGSANAPQRPTANRGGGMPGRIPEGDITGGTIPNGEIPESGMSGRGLPAGEMPEGDSPPRQRGNRDRGQTPASPATAATDPVFAEMNPNDTAAAETGGSDDASIETAASDSSKGLKAGTDLGVTGGSFLIDSADDTLHANGNVSISGGTFTLSTGDDGIHADADLTISGSPAIDILTSYEGLEGAAVTVSDGDIAIVATDDGINAAGGADGSNGGMFGPDSFNSGSGEYKISIEGGNITLIAGADGLDSNGDLLISGGVITISMTNPNTTSGDGMLDKDGAFSITGGTILGAGGSGVVVMGRSASDSTATQPILQLNYTNTQAAGTPVELQDASGNVLAAFTPARDFTCVIFSVPALVLEESYSVYTCGEKTLDLTLTDLVTSIRDTGEAVTGMDGFGGGRGGFGGRGPAMMPATSGNTAPAQ